MEPFADVVEQYAELARYAAGDSACFEEWATGVAGDPEVLAWIGALPVAKRQPTLVFAAARWHGVPAPAPYAALRAALLADDGSIRATILARATQTNEVGRLATLVPALAELARRADDRPLALLEVGASAGLCLYPDRYDYAWHTPSGVVTASRRDGRAGAVGGPAPAPLRCDVTGEPPLPSRPPAVAWRGGIDLHPLDVHDDDAMRWLTTLVWPEHDERRRRLRDAVAVARREPPRLVAGDLLEELPELVEEAGRHGPVVVFHTAVIAYLEPPERARFSALMTGLVADGRCHWVSNEGKRVLPAITATGPAPPEELATFVLGVDGRAVAWTHGHGRSMTWLG
jgi:hypothetical protein